MTLDDFITEIYVCIDDELKKLENCNKLRARGFSPKLTDSEVITIEVVGEYLKLDKDLGLWKYFKNNKFYLFAKLGSRPNFVKQSSNLWKVKHLLHAELIEKYFGHTGIHIIDGFPMPICNYVRAYKCRSFKNEAGYGYCSAKDEKYYGFKGHIIVNDLGVIEKIGVALPNIDERDVMLEIVDNIKGLLIGDKGYISAEKKGLLKEYGIDLETPARINMKENRDPVFVKLIRKKRKIVETVISQLTRIFNIENIRVKNLWHLTNRIIRKILAHNICTIINLMHGSTILDIEPIVN